MLTPYQINVVPVQDHWRNDYVYTSDAVNYSLESNGKDGLDGANMQEELLDIPAFLRRQAD